MPYLDTQRAITNYLIYLSVMMGTCAMLGAVAIVIVYTGVV